MNKKLLIILAFFWIAYTGCKKNVVIIPPPAASDSYFPETKGSTWKYRDSIYNTKVDTLTSYGIKIDTLSYTMTGAITNFNNAFCYNAAINSKLNGASTAYFYGLKHIFALRSTSPPYGFTGLEMLIDTASVGFSWTSSPTNDTYLNGNPVRTINTIMETGITKRINGVTFANVIHTSVNFQVDVTNAGYHNTILYDFYLAKGVGLIELDTYAYGSFNSVQTILNYNIK